MLMKAKGKHARRGHSRLLPYLLLAAVVTGLTATGTLAKYSSSFSADVSAEVAAFAGGGTMNFEVALEDMVPGSARTVQLAVQNYDEQQDCEVQLDYEIQVETTGNLPLTFQLIGKKEAGDENADSVLAGALDSTLKASGGKLPLASESRTRHTYELSITWPQEATDWDYSQEIDMLTVTVTTVQADPAAG